MKFLLPLLSAIIAGYIGFVTGVNWNANAQKEALKKAETQIQAQYKASFEAAVAKIEKESTPPTAPSPITPSTPVDVKDLWHICGKIIQKTDKGLLVQCFQKSSYADKIPRYHKEILLTDHFNESYLVDDDKVSIIAVETGQFEFPTVLGAKKTIRTFSARGESIDPEYQDPWRKTSSFDGWR